MPPVAPSVNVTLAEDNSQTLDLLQGVTDPDVDPMTGVGNPLRLIGVSQPGNGAAVVNADNTVTYTPYQDYTGADCFTYRVKSSTQPDNGTVTVNPDGSFAYTPADPFGGGYTSFTYVATDGIADSAPARVYLFLPSNPIIGPPGNPPLFPPPPVAVGDRYYLGDDPAGVAGNVLANDQNAFLAILVKPPAYGRLVPFADDGSFQYVPDPLRAGGTVPSVEVLPDGTQAYTIPLAYQAYSRQGAFSTAGLSLIQPAPQLLAKTINLNAPATDSWRDVGMNRNPGVFVHFNIDDDFDRTLGAPTIPDCLRLDFPNPNEDDLKGLRIGVAGLGGAPGVPMEGTVTLTRSNPYLRLWRSAAKGPGQELLVDADCKTWDLSDPAQYADFTTLWGGNEPGVFAEGYLPTEQIAGYGMVGTGTQDGTTDLELRYLPPQGAASTTVMTFHFYAANKGRQPTHFERGRMEGLFPRLVSCEWSVTDEATPIPVRADGRAYNCFAFAAGDLFHFWNHFGDDDGPGLVIRSLPKHYGDPAIPRDNVYDHDFDLFYQKFNGVPYNPNAAGLGLKPIAGLNPLVIKVALFRRQQQIGDIDTTDSLGITVAAQEKGIWHAAKNDGGTLAQGILAMWECKYGADIRIQHVWNQMDRNDERSDRFYR